MSALTTAEPAYPDTITFTGSSIALRGCSVQAIQGGQVYYNDPGKQRQRRPIEQVAALGFDGLPELDQAEAALVQQDTATGLWAMLRALLKAETDLQRLWIHIRLAHVHDSRGEYVQAAGHAASVFLLSDDVSWKPLRPASPVNQPSYAAAREALLVLQTAQGKLKSAELKREAETMLTAVQLVHDKLAATYSGPAIEPNSTLSGFSRAQLLASDQPLDVSGTAASRPAGPAPAPPRETPPTPPPAPADPRSSPAIDQLLTNGKWNDALAICQSLEKNPGDRDLAHFLYQYGQALSHTGRKRDAAIMLTRAAVLFPDSADAGPALIETAVIYRDEYQNPATARRLLEKVIADAEREGRQSTAMLARELLSSVK